MLASIEIAYIGIGGTAVTSSIGILLWLLGRSRASKYRVIEEEKKRQEGLKLCHSAVQSLALAVEAIDPDNRGHLRCVQQVALRLATAMSLPEDDTWALRFGSLLHNVGRLGVPENILHKQNPLTPEERIIMQQQPEIAARIVSSIPFQWDVATVVRHHTEHWNGYGYPNGLAGEDIPLSARILSVAIAFSALQRARAYRKAVTPDQAFKKVAELSGTQFDPEVVAQLKNIITEIIEGTAAPVPILNVFGEEEVESDSLQEAIVPAQREKRALHIIQQVISENAEMQMLCMSVLDTVSEILPSDCCILFLTEEDGEYLCARYTKGLHDERLKGALARIGTFTTGRAFLRGEANIAPYQIDDLLITGELRAKLPFRTLLSVPLIADNRTKVGCLNFYTTESDGFSLNDRRLIERIAAPIGTALYTAKITAEASEDTLFDALTGLRNGKYVRDFLRKEMNRATRSKEPIALLNLDLDNFSQINSRLGRERGDQVLREVALCLTGQIRNYDLVARSDSDQFLIVMPTANRDEAALATERIRNEIERMRVRISLHEPNFPKLGISIGVAIYPENGLDVDMLLLHSDSEMLADKTRRNAHSGHDFFEDENAALAGNDPSLKALLQATSINGRSY